MPILMSAANLTDAKLEDHHCELVAEIEPKCWKNEADPRAQAQAVRHQEHSMRVLADMAPNQGPTGTPRIGKGSPGFAA